MQKIIEYGLMAINTGKVFPKIFNTKDDAEKYRLRSVDPEHWKVVSREVMYGEWK